MENWIKLCLFLALVIGTCRASNSRTVECEACEAVVEQALKKIQDVNPSSNRESEVKRAVGGLCDVANFITYEFSPPKMIKACKDMVQRHGQQLEHMLTQKRSKTEILKSLCLKTKICKSLKTGKEDL